MSYSLDIISLHSEFAGQKFKKYVVDTSEYIGVYGNEPFEILFTNHLAERVQVKLAIDGIDLLNNSKMWVVEALGTMKLRAWPETNEGGAQFVFTDSNGSVAAHTGKVTNRGIITATVFKETYQVNYCQPYWPFWNGYTFPKETWISSPDYWGTGGTWSTTITCNTSVPGVGAGDTVTQKLESSVGLNIPKLDRVITVKYLWWNDLVKLLERCRTEKILDLGTTPRIKSKDMMDRLAHEINLGRFNY